MITVVVPTADQATGVGGAADPGPGGQQLQGGHGEGGHRPPPQGDGQGQQEGPGHRDRQVGGEPPRAGEQHPQHHPEHQVHGDDEDKAGAAGDQGGDHPCRAERGRQQQRQVQGLGELGHVGVVFHHDDQRRPQHACGQGDPRRGGHVPVGAGEQADQHAQGADHRQQVRGRPEHRVTPERGVPERVGGRGRRGRDRRSDREGEPGSAEHGGHGSCRGQPPPPPAGDHDPDGEDRRIQQQVRRDEGAVPAEGGVPGVVPIRRPNPGGRGRCGDPDAPCPQRRGTAGRVRLGRDGGAVTAAVWSHGLSFL